MLAMARPTHIFCSTMETASKFRSMLGVVSSHHERAFVRHTVSEAVALYRSTVFGPGRTGLQGDHVIFFRGLEFWDFSASRLLLRPSKESITAAVRRISPKRRTDKPRRYTVIAVRCDHHGNVRPVNAASLKFGGGGATVKATRAMVRRLIRTVMTASQAHK